MNILFIGDVVGRPGRRLLTETLPGLKEEFGVNMTIANGENSAGGIGITAKTARELFDAGVDLITTGNHIWDQREALKFVDREPRLLRPLNYPPDTTPGQGMGIVKTPQGANVAVLNVHGRVFIPTGFSCPFRAVEAQLVELKASSSPPTHIIIDFHAEATSEKIALGRYFDGSVTAVLGTHTHVQTADAAVLQHGTGYVTDVGMTGPADGVIGVDAVPIIEQFYTQLPARFRVAKGRRMLNAVLLKCDPEGAPAHTRTIDLIRRFYDE